MFFWKFKVSSFKWCNKIIDQFLAHFRQKPWTIYKWVKIPKLGYFKNFKLSILSCRVFHGLSENHNIIQIGLPEQNLLLFKENYILKNGWLSTELLPVVAVYHKGRYEWPWRDKGDMGQDDRAVCTCVCMRDIDIHFTLYKLIIMYIQYTVYLINTYNYSTCIWQALEAGFHLCFFLYINI